MGYYMNWVQALVTAWAFMFLLGLMCCCLSSKPRPHGDTSSGSGGCACDGAYGGVDLHI
ncbi:hypothetical protein RHMOL_Rhmol05G0274400 [Rhododendron molle]|uniref:Uncharacterized protein n=1 Tax=Rhododendron molle TaxID=49168 RepID=A0ACC0NTL6_RHOML|nr:hypothetical protein RHMOL_Rhmol05G0274400 [Rhododendron molle]